MDVSSSENLQQNWFLFSSEADSPLKLRLQYLQQPVGRL
jgi:hypothetical protein